MCAASISVLESFGRRRSVDNAVDCFCIGLEVDYTSKRKETFYDIQLNIKSEKGHDLQTIEESLREFTAEEVLDGDNLYEAEGFGKQRAKKAGLCSTWKAPRIEFKYNILQYTCKICEQHR